GVRRQAVGRPSEHAAVRLLPRHAPADPGLARGERAGRPRPHARRPLAGLTSRGKRRPVSYSTRAGGLAEADILTRKNVERRTTGYFARDIFDLPTFAERRLASTRWDTRKPWVASEPLEV